MLLVVRYKNAGKTLDIEKYFLFILNKCFTSLLLYVLFSSNQVALVYESPNWRETATTLQTFKSTRFFS